MRAKQPKIRSKEQLHNLSLNYRNALRSNTVAGLVFAEELLKAGAYVDYCDDSDPLNKFTALENALGTNDFGRLQWLVQHGANVNRLDATELAPLDFAFQLNRKEIISFLKKNGAKSGNEIKKELNKKFRIALRIGKLDMVQDCLKKGANINYYDNVSGSKDEFTALEEAAESGKEDIVVFLIENKADIDFANKVDGGTALHAAIKNNHQDIARILITAGADFNKEDAFGDKALDHATNDLVKWVVELLQKGLIKTEERLIPAEYNPSAEAQEKPTSSKPELSKASKSASVPTFEEQMEEIDELIKVTMEQSKRSEVTESKPGEVDKLMKDFEKGNIPRPQRKLEGKYHPASKEVKVKEESEISTSEEWAKAKNLASWAEIALREKPDLKSSPDECRKQPFLRK